MLHGASDVLQIDSGALRFLALLLRGVAGAAQAHPVGPVPEQRHVASMRDDVVNRVGRCHPSLAIAVHTERVVIEVDQPSLLPLVVVATLTGRDLSGTP